jgi:hypothetical protein
MKKLEFMTEPELKDLMNALGNKLVETCAAKGVEKPLFALLLFNDPKVAQYIANCHRDDVIEAMRTCANRIEGKQDIER